MSNYDDFDDNDSFVSRFGSRFGVRHGVMALGVILALGIGYAVLSGDDNGGTSGNVPLIRADNTPYKVAPEEVGGMPVPNQNSTIFETLKGDGAEKPRIENLLAEDEQPMTKADIAPVEKPSEKVEDEKVAMIDPQSDTAKPEPMPSAPEGSDIANTEPSATDASEQPVTATDETPMVVKADAPKPEEIKKEEPKVETAKLVEPEEEPKPTEPKKEEPKKEVATASGSASIQFAAVKSDEEARKLWSSLQSKNPELQGKTLRVQKADLGAKGVFYRVQVAGLSADTASSICGSGKSRGGSCMVVK
mgnify:CR=1 FL=1